MKEAHKVFIQVAPLPPLSLTCSFTLFFQLAQSPEGTELIFSAPVVDALKHAQKDERYQLRVMELFAEISTLSSQLLHLAENDFLLPIVHIFHTTSDILTKLNAVELLDKVKFFFLSFEY